jgi:hypothetical protein
VQIWNNTKSKSEVITLLLLYLMQIGNILRSCSLGNDNHTILNLQSHHQTPHLIFQLKEKIPQTLLRICNREMLIVRTPYWFLHVCHRHKDQHQSFHTPVL